VLAGVLQGFGMGVVLCLHHITHAPARHQLGQQHRRRMAVDQGAIWVKWSDRLHGAWLICSSNWRWMSWNCMSPRVLMMPSLTVRMPAGSMRPAGSARLRCVGRRFRWPGARPRRLRRRHPGLGQRLDDRRSDTVHFRDGLRGAPCDKVLDVACVASGAMRRPDTGRQHVLHGLPLTELQVGSPDLAGLAWWMSPARITQALACLCR
jgi:hypothetical protein